MARLAYYDQAALLDELTALLQSAEFLRSKIHVTEDLKKLATKMFPKSLKRALNSDESAGVSRVDALKVFGHAKAKIQLAKHFKRDVTAMKISRRRLEHLLEDGDIDILDCDAAIRQFWKVVWECVQKLPADIQVIAGDDYMQTDFGDQCKLLGFPDVCLEYFTDILADKHQPNAIFPNGMGPRMRRMVKAFADGASHAGMQERFGITGGYSRKIKSDNKELIADIQAGKRF